MTLLGVILPPHFWAIADALEHLCKATDQDTRKAISILARSNEETKSAARAEQIKPLNMKTVETPSPATKTPIEEAFGAQLESRKGDLFERIAIAAVTGAGITSDGSPQTHTDRAMDVAERLTAALEKRFEKAA